VTGEPLDLDSAGFRRFLMLGLTTNFYPFFTLNNDHTSFAV